jgi:hypothetical protein
MKFTNITNLCILFFILLVLGVLYRRFEDKRMNEENKQDYDAIQQYLLDDVTLGKSKKPILWIHVPYEYNSRNWLSFGSRNSFDLNQPYLYLTLRSIIHHCKDSFTICIVDDASFHKLMPEWNIDLTKLADPILCNMRVLGLMKLLYRYGGMLCPISFLCMRDLIDLYQKGTRRGTMFVCETVNTNYTSARETFYPSVSFCGAPKECKTVGAFCDYIRIIASNDHSAETKFTGLHDAWCMKQIQEGNIHLISGIDIGTKSMDDTPVLLDDLMSNHYLKIYKDSYGILIPSKELLQRIQYGWFVRSSAKQVMESDTIIGNYLLLSIGKTFVLEPIQSSINKTIEKKYVGFWKLPSDAPYYGLKPNYLGDNLPRL